MSKKDLQELTLGKYTLRQKARSNKFYDIYLAVDSSKGSDPRQPVEVRVADMSNGFHVKLLEYDNRVRKEMASCGSL